MRSMVVGAETGAALEVRPLHRFAVPLPRCAGEDLSRLTQAATGTARRIRVCTAAGSVAG